MADVSLRGVHKRYGAVDVIKGVDIDIADGEFAVFVGPSGCGKSTLLRMIAGLEDISEGELRIGERVVNTVPAYERGIAMVFQSYAVFPHMSVRENMAFGLTIAGASRAEKTARVDAAARILQMEHLLDRRPSQLSGGQRQRVAIGRAIVREPAVFLFDEPLSNLDAALRLDMRIEIGKLHQSLGSTMVYVTHDQVEAMTLADKIVVLREGVVQQIGAPMEVFHRPVNRFVAGFIGAPSMNFLPVEMLAAEGDRRRVRSPVLGEVDVAAWRAGIGGAGPAVVGIRPQHLRPVDAGGRLRGTVSLVERLGAETVVEMSMADGGRLLASLAEDARLSRGETLTLDFDPQHAHLFSADDDPVAQRP